MNQRLVDQIVDAVLYEGYILYPYRPSVKNQKRWTFGGLYPRAHCEAHRAGDDWSAQTECLLRGHENTVVRVVVRFLHLQSRLVGQLDSPAPDFALNGDSRFGEGEPSGEPHSDPARREPRPPGITRARSGAEPAYHVVDQLQVGDRLLQTWQEAVQREVVLDGLELASLASAPRYSTVFFPPSRQIEAVRGPSGTIDAVVVREQHAVTVRVQVSALAVGRGLFKLIARVENDTPLEDAGQTGRDQAVLHALASTHTILSMHHGEFISLIDPGEECREVAAACRNHGTWPVLIGRAGETDAMLSSPIILYDYPQIAGESPGDFFDGTEIDEMLVLRIQTLTDDEKQAARAVDERARALLARTSELSEESMMRLHGTVRGLRPVPSGESP
jgi:hypothetical protein